MLTRPGEIETLTGSASNAAVILTVPATKDVRRHLSKLLFSYSAAPTNGLLTVSVGSEVRFGPLPITAGGPGPIGVNIQGDVNQAMTVVLSAGGSGVIGALYVEYVSSTR